MHSFLTAFQCHLNGGGRLVTDSLTGDSLKNYPLYQFKTDDSGIVPWRPKFNQWLVIQQPCTDLLNEFQVTWKGCLPSVGLMERKQLQMLNKVLHRPYNKAYTALARCVYHQKLCLEHEKYSLACPEKQLELLWASQSMFFSQRSSTCMFVLCLCSRYPAVTLKERMRKQTKKKIRTRTDTPIFSHVSFVFCLYAVSHSHSLSRFLTYSFGSIRFSSAQFNSICFNAIRFSSSTLLALQIKLHLYC